MEYWNLLFKSTVSLIALFFLAKFLGKKQMGQLNMYDYIIGISIGNVVAEMSVNKEVVFIEGLLVMVVYTVIAYFVTLITTKSIKFRRFMTGTPLVIIEDGKIIERKLVDAKLDVNDLLEEARINGYFDINEIEFAIMESNGRISFLPKSKFKPLVPNDMKQKPKYKGLSCNLVLDGNIMRRHLKYVNKDEKWLRTRLENMGYLDISNILLAVCDSDEKITVFEKDVEQKKINCIE